MTTTGACRDGKRLLCLMKEDASLLESCVKNGWRTSRKTTRLQRPAGFRQKKNPTSNEVGFGARYRTRTCDPMHVKHVL